MFPENTIFDTDKFAFSRKRENQTKAKETSSATSSCKYVQQNHAFNTRNAANYCSHYCRTNIEQFTILNQGPKVWNSLPRYFTLSSSYSSFETSLKTISS